MNRKLRECKRAKKIVSNDHVATHVIEPVNPNFCVVVKWLEYIIALSIIRDVPRYEELTNTVLQKYLGTKEEEYKTLVTLIALNNIVGQELGIIMKEDNATSRMENVFISWHTLLHRHSLLSKPIENQIVSVSQVSSTIRPRALKDRVM